jgi:mRNA interferase HigB
MAPARNFGSIFKSKSRQQTGRRRQTRAIRSASILKDGRAVFNLAGNKYRLVVWINYPYRVVYIRFIGTHRQYDMIDVQKV